MKTIKIDSQFELIPKKYTGCVEFRTKTKAYYRNGKLHREDGPAVEVFTGTNYYYLNNKIIKDESLYLFLILTFIRNEKKIPEIYFNEKNEGR